MRHDLVMTPKTEKILKLSIAIMTILLIVGVIAIVYKIVDDFVESDKPFEIHLPQQFKGKTIDYVQDIILPKNAKVVHFSATATHIFLYLETKNQPDEVWVVEHLTGKRLRRFRIGNEE